MGQDLHTKTLTQLAAGLEQGEFSSVELTTALLDGTIGFVGVSGEFFCGHALSLRKRAQLPHLFFFGYCNDHHLYFPTIEAAAEGGYGTQLPVSIVPPGAGEKMMDQALVHLSQMQRKVAESSEN